MRKIVSLLLPFGMIFALAACGQSAVSEKQEEIQSAVQKTEEQSEAPQNGAAVEQSETEDGNRNGNRAVRIRFDRGTGGKFERKTLSNY